MLYENPPAVGAAAAVTGAAVGMMVPETQPEHKIMGEARDNLVDKSQSATQNARGKVSQVASEAATAARQAASDQGLVADNTQQ